MNFGTIILYTLLGLYGLYCITFLIAVFYTLYKERQEERRGILEEVDGFTDSEEDDLPSNI
tara:strand:- start:279 stop:461 length:183 start_codon:yes stop_codon:yes gene_type:complete